MEECKGEPYYIRDVKGENIIQKEQITYIESNGRRLHFHVGDEDYITYSKLDDMERELNDPHFLRIHKSFLVNMRFIERMDGCRVYLKTGSVLPVPKARYTDVREDYIFWRELFGGE